MPELIVQTGHSEPVLTTAFSRDGRFFATGAADSTVKIWTAGPEVEELRTFKIDRGERIVAIAFAPDGKFLAAAAHDRVTVWDLETGNEKLRLTIDTVSSIAFSPNGALLAVAGGSYKNITLQLFKIVDGQPSTSFVEHIDKINALAFSSDGHRLLSASSDRKTILWDVEKAVPAKTFAHDAAVMDACFLPDDRTIAAVDNDRVLLWDIENQSSRTPQQRSPGTRISCSADGKKIAVLSTSVVRIFDASTLVEIESIETDPYVFDPRTPATQFVNSRRFSVLGLDPNWKTVIKSDGRKYYFEVFDIEKRRAYFRTTSSSSGVLATVLSPALTHLASSHSDHSVRLWGLSAGSEMLTLTGHSGVVTSMRFSPSGDLLATSDGAELIVWSVTRSKLLHRFVIAQKKSPAPEQLWSGLQDDLAKMNFDLLGNSGLAFSNDEKILAAFAEGAIRLWDLDSGKEARPIKTDVYGSMAKVDLAFLREGMTIATIPAGADSGKIMLWDVTSGKKLSAGPAEIAPIKTQARDQRISPDGKWFLHRAANGQLVLIDIAARKIRAYLAAVDDRNWLVTTPDGLFDGPPDAWHRLKWRFDGNTFSYAPVEVFFREFFYPGLLEDILRGEVPSPPTKDLASVDIRQPTVRIVKVNARTVEPGNFVTDSGKVTVTIQVIDNTTRVSNASFPVSSGAWDLRLFRNGSLVKLWKSGRRQGPRNNVFDLSETEGCKQVPAVGEPATTICEIEIPVTSGDNRLTAYAFNHHDVKSGNAEAIVKASVPKRDGTLYLIGIGINDYWPEGNAPGERGLDLEFAVADIDGVTRDILSGQHRLMNDPKLRRYGRTEVIRLTDKDATRENIMFTLKRFSAQGSGPEFPTPMSDTLRAQLMKLSAVGPDDGVMIYFAGHGRSGGERFFLLPHDYRAGSGDKAISDLDLRSVFEDVGAGKILMVIDACYSGQALGDKREGRGPMNSKGLAQLAYDKGMYVLTASQSYQTALEGVLVADKRIPNGLLTYSLLQAFVDQAADRDGSGSLTAREWLDFATAAVPDLQRAANHHREVEAAKAVSPNKSRADDFVDGQKSDPRYRIQTPRVFYRRESEADPLLMSLKR